MSGFHAAALREQYAFVESCSPELLDKLIEFTSDTLEARVQGAAAWRDALLRGHLPGHDVWPPPELSAPVRAALTELDLPRFCADHAELVDALMPQIVDAFARRTTDFAQKVTEELAKLAALERAQPDDAEARRQLPIDDATWERLRRRAHEAAASQATLPDPTLINTWQETTRLWADMSSVFGDLGLMLGRGWDMSTQLLHHVGWQDLLQLKILVERLPQLRELIETLGRVQQTDDPDVPSVAETVMSEVRRVHLEAHEVPPPFAPTETKGITRSADIASMLPAEAALLGHPTLRRLWHARRAERALMTYRREGTMVEYREVESVEQQANQQAAPPKRRGPIVAVVDTSGSMHGAPERFAKALVLQALCTAHAENRRCLLFAYSGPGQVITHELSLTPGGLSELLSFLGFSFGGGNDEHSVLTAVVERLVQEDWHNADVLWVSDGEWPTPTRLIDLANRAKENGTRFHGVQIGNRGRSGLHALCDPVHELAQWVAGL